MNLQNQMTYKNDVMKLLKKLTTIYLLVQIQNAPTLHLLKHQKEKKKKKIQIKKPIPKSNYNTIHPCLRNTSLINHIKNTLKEIMNHRTNPTLIHSSSILKANIKQHSKNKFLLPSLIN